MLALLNVLKNLKVSNVAGGVAIREYAARKGTREKRLKLKKKKKAEKKVEAPVKKIYGREGNLVHVKQRPFDDSHYPSPVDNVYFHRKFRVQEYSFKDVVQFHREVHHETVYNQPTAPLYIRMDIDLKYPNRVTKCQDPWRSMVEMKAPFQIEGQTIPTVLAFCQENDEQIEASLAAGAEKAGGADLIKACQEGLVRPSDYDYVVCHPLVLTELTAIRGLMKQQFPSIKSRTIGPDLASVVRSLKNGVRIKLNHSNQEPDFGHFTACVGRLNMPTEDLEGNFQAYVKDTMSKKVTGKAPDAFLLQCHAFTAFSFEKLRIDWRPYAPATK